MTRNWEDHWATFPLRAADTDYLRQVGKTVGGQAITDAQFRQIVREIGDRLDLAPTDRLLDLACGNGLITAALAASCESVVGVDWSEPLLAVARRDHALANVAYVRASVLELSPELLPGRRPFTKVLMYEALQHFRRRDLPEILRRIERVSERPKVLLGSVPDRGRLWRFYDTPRRKLAYLRGRLTGTEALGTWWRRDDVRRAAAEARLTCAFHEQHESLHTSHYRFDVVLRAATFERVLVLTGMPRSGTSWLGQIVDSSPRVRYRLSPLWSPQFKRAVDERSTRDEYEAVFRGAYVSDDRFMTQAEQRERGGYATFPDEDEAPEVLAIKQTRFHNLLERMLELFDELKVVVVVRDPRGAIHSWLKAPLEFPADADPRTEWRTGACRKDHPTEFWGFEDWKRATRLHLRLEREHPDRFLVVRYEELVERPLEVTERIFAFAGLEVTEQTRAFLAASHARHVDDPYAVFKRPEVKDRWRGELDPDIARTIVDEVRGTELEAFLS